MQTKSLRTDRESILLFAVVFLMYTLVYMTKNCFSAAMAAIVNEGSMTKSQTGLISAVFYLIYAPFQIIGGAAADKVSPARLITFGILGAAVINLLVFFVDGYMALLVLWGINAVVQFGIWPSIFKIVSAQLARPYRKKCLFYISLASTCGLLISYLSAAVITNWKTHFLFSAIVLFSAAALFFFGYRAVEGKMVVEAQEEAASSAPAKSGKWRAMLLSGLPLLLIAYCILGVLQLGIKALFPVMLMESYAGFPPSLANLSNTVLILAAPFGVFLGRVPAFSKRSPVFVIAAVFFASLFLLFPSLFVGTLSPLLLIFTLALFMVAVQLLTVFFLQVPAAFTSFGCAATVSGILNCMAALGIVIANYGFARIAELFGWSAATRGWLLLTFFAAVLSLLALPFWRRFTKDEKEI